MSIVIVTGSGGLIGAEACRQFHALGHDVWGIDNDMRARFFGAEASTGWMRARLSDELPRYTDHDVDIRDDAAIDALFGRGSGDVHAVIHTAAQPSHDWAARDPRTDFGVNAVGTMNLLEACRKHSPSAAFLFTSTNKVYGDTPNRLPLIEADTRWQVAEDHPYASRGIDEQMSIDHSTHSLFGVSKSAADLMVQEYGRYFGLKTVVFRGGCLTGPGHSGAELHGFLAYLMKCTATGRPYTVFGYKGKQVRDNIHSRDFVEALLVAAAAPVPGSVYNMGGGPQSNCSMLEAIELCQEVAGRRLEWTYSDEHRIGDHQWYVSDLGKFKSDYPSWQLQYDVPGILSDIFEANRSRWA